MISPPGAAYSYCNSGFVLLGRMIEVLDGRVWDESLRERLVRPLGELAGITLPADPAPFSGPLGSDIARHAGRYERSARRIDVRVLDGQLRAVFETTGPLGAIRDSEPEEADLYPADSSGDNFVCRSHDAEPWVPLSFGALADGRPYLYMGGRITLRAGGQ